MNNSGLNNPISFAPDFSKAIDPSSETYTAPDDGWIVSCAGGYSGVMYINSVPVNLPFKVCSEFGRVPGDVINLFYIHLIIIFA